jgi:hypothetical protein
MGKSVFFTKDDLTTVNLSDAASNTAVADVSGTYTSIRSGVDASYSVKVTTGTRAKNGAANITIDIRSPVAMNTVAATTGDTLKMRVDLYENDGMVYTHTSPAIYKNDICNVVGNWLATKTNIGERHADEAQDENPPPFFFRTVLAQDTGQGADVSGWRVTLSGPEIKVGMKANVFLDFCGETVSLMNNTCDVSFTAEKAQNMPQMLVNAGPVGGPAKSANDKALPVFTAAMLKIGTGSTQSGKIVILTDTPLFANDGAGISLNRATFLLKDQTSAGKPESEKVIDFPTGGEKKNASGKYENLLVDITSVNMSTYTGKSFSIAALNVRDDFNLIKTINLAMDGVINFNNKPEKISVGSITIDSDASRGDTTGLDDVYGKKAIVTFTAPSTAEGAKSITKYEARYITRAQAFGPTLNKDAINFEHVKAAFPSQVNVNTDVCNTTGVVQPSILLTLAGNSVMLADGSVDPNTRYGVFVRAYTSSDTGYIAGADDVDVSAAGFADASAANTPNVSLGFFVSGRPAAPYDGAIHTGSNLLRGDDTNTDTDAKKDMSMNDALTIRYKEQNKDMRGDNYDSLRFAIVPAASVVAAGTIDLDDASFTIVPGTHQWQGNSNKILDAHISGDVVLNDFNTETNKWTARGNTNKNISNGVELAINFAFDNSNGIGQRTGWKSFKASTRTNTAKQLWKVDASNSALQLHKFGETTGLAGSNALAFTNNSTYVGLSDTLKNSYKLSTSERKIGFSFSALDPSAIELKDAGAQYYTKAELDGGKNITSLTYMVKPSASVTTNTAKRAFYEHIRRYGQTNDDVCGTPWTSADKYQTIAATRDTTRLVVSNGLNGKNEKTQLKNGRRYDISFAVTNQNGVPSDASFAATNGFAPMGSIAKLSPMKGLTVVGIDSNRKALFDISMRDLCGEAQLGGHLITKYVYRVTQYQGDVSGDQEIMAATAYTTNASGDVMTGYDNSLSLPTDQRHHRIQVTTTEEALAGWPMKFHIKAVAEVSSTPTNKDVSYSNYFHNVGGLEAEGPEAIVNLPGPIYNTGQNDEVRSLIVTPKNNKLNVNFWKPINTNFNEDNMPSLVSYKVGVFDISLTTTSYDEAMSLNSQTVTNASDNVSFDLNLVNGKAYIVRVQSIWKSANGDIATSMGSYSSNPLSIGFNDDASSNTPLPGHWTLPASATPTSGAALKHLSIPARSPDISLGYNGGLRFHDNGSQLTTGVMIQVSKKNNYGTGASDVSADAFFLDLCADLASPAVKGVVVNPVKVGGHVTNASVYDVSGDVLGANWDAESNFISIQNQYGTAYVKMNL